MEGIKRYCKFLKPEARFAASVPELIVRAKHHQDPHFHLLLLVLQIPNESDPRQHGSRRCRKEQLDDGIAQYLGIGWS